jgi:hypothetical protein
MTTEKLLADFLTQEEAAAELKVCKRTARDPTTRWTRTSNDRFGNDAFARQGYGRRIP